jgi:hypothetical protein
VQKRNESKDGLSVGAGLVPGRYFSKDSTPNLKEQGQEQALPL